MFWFRLGVIINFVFWSTGCMGAATTTAVCITDEWTFNQVGMSPCLLAANLEAVCNGGDWNIPALPPGSDYSGPTSQQATECTCSTVVYSLVAACSICQQREITTWSNWRENCTDHDVSISLYPLTIPTGMTIPAWAYLNVTESNTFDPNAALSVHNAGVPDVSTGNSTVKPPPVSTISKPGNNHLGAIIGGVVGGIVLIIIITCTVYYFGIRRRRDSHIVKKTRYDMAASPVPMNPPFAAIMAPLVPPHEFKLYDPSDPTTFPHSPSPSLPTYRSSEIHNNNGYVTSPDTDITPPLPYAGHHGQYTGVPEV